MKYMLLLLAVLPIFVVGCGNTSVPVNPVPTVTPVKKSPSVRPVVRYVTVRTQAADDKSEEVERAVVAAEAKVEDHKVAIQGLTDTIKILSERGSATAKELEDLYVRIKAQVKTILSLESDLGAAIKAQKEENVLRKEIADKLEDVKELLADKENETETLRQQFKDSVTNIKNYHDKLELLTKQSEEHADKAATLEGRVDVYFNIIVVLVIMLVGGVVLFYFVIKTKGMPFL